MVCKRHLDSSRENLERKKGETTGEKNNQFIADVNRIDIYKRGRVESSSFKTSATVKGTTGNYGATYVVRAKSGQKLILNLAPAQKVGIRIETDGRFGQTVLLREQRGGSYEVGLEESGDYTIFIGSTEGKSNPFTLRVKITNMTDI